MAGDAHVDESQFKGMAKTVMHDKVGSQQLNFRARVAVQVARTHDFIVVE